MFVCIAALLDDASQNIIRAKIGPMMGRYHLAATAVLLPQHVSLKISFRCPDLERLVHYFDRLCATVHTVEIELDKIEAIPIEDQGKPSGLVWYNVVENGPLRSLHNQLNADLPDLFGIKNSPIDGAGYRFHTTLAYGSRSFEDYQHILHQESQQFGPMMATLDRLAMFCSHEEQISAGTFYVHRTQQLTMA